MPPPSAHDLPTPARALAFDTQQELLWVGNDYGRVAGFHGPELRRYTSFRAHPAGAGAVQQLLAHERGILSLAPTSVHLASRRGLAVWHLADAERLPRLRCMAFGGRDEARAPLVVAGCQPLLAKVDAERGRVLSTHPAAAEYELLRFARYLCAATATGAVHLLDPTSLAVVKALATNTVGVADMAARDPYLVTCGWVRRPPAPGSGPPPGGGPPQPPLLAGLANVYDLRALVQLPPVPFHAGAARVAMHPRLSTTCILASQAGQLQVVDLMSAGAQGTGATGGGPGGGGGPPSVQLRQINMGGYVTALALAPAGEALAVADADGWLHLWGSPSKLRFGEDGGAGQLPEWGDVGAPVPYVDLAADVPLSAVGLPYYREQLLSAWPSAPVAEVGAPPARPDPALLATARPYEVGVLASNPRTHRRNQAERTRAAAEAHDGAGGLAAPRFLSERAREAEGDAETDRQLRQLGDALGEAALADGVKSDVPVIYRNVEIKYSRFGVDDFDFECVSVPPARRV